MKCKILDFFRCLELHPADFRLHLIDPRLDRRVHIRSKRWQSGNEITQRSISRKRILPIDELPLKRQDRIPAPVKSKVSTQTSKAICDCLSGPGETEQPNLW